MHLISNSQVDRRYQIHKINERDLELSPFVGENMGLVETDNESTGTDNESTCW